MTDSGTSFFASLHGLFCSLTWQRAWRRCTVLHIFCLPPRSPAPYLGQVAPAMSASASPRAVLRWIILHAIVLQSLCQLCPCLLACRTLIVFLLVIRLSTTVSGRREAATARRGLEAWRRKANCSYGQHNVYLVNNKCDIPGGPPGGKPAGGNPARRKVSKSFSQYFDRATHEAVLLCLGIHPAALQGTRHLGNRVHQHQPQALAVQCLRLSQRASISQELASSKAHPQHRPAHSFLVAPTHPPVEVHLPSTTRPSRLARSPILAFASPQSRLAVHQPLRRVRLSPSSCASLSGTPRNRPGPGSCACRKPASVRLAGVHRPSLLACDS